MEKNNELRKRIWKIFWRNKALELSGLLGLIFLPYWTGRLVELIYPLYQYIQSYWLEGLFALGMLGFISMIIYWIIICNWEIAVREAKGKKTKTIKKRINELLNS